MDLQPGINITNDEERQRVIDFVTNSHAWMMSRVQNGENADDLFTGQGRMLFATQLGVPQFPFNGFGNVLRPMLGNHAVADGSNATYAPPQGAGEVAMDEHSDSDETTSQAASSDRLSSPPASPSPPPPTQHGLSSATSLTKTVSPSDNMLRALSKAKLTKKAEPSPKLESSEASRLKRSFSEISGKTPAGKRLMGESDPENREIMRLRQEENLEFDEIARIMNQNRVKAHLPARFTANAIYSRYKRNGPLIAAAQGKEFVPAPRDKKPNGRGGISFKKAFILEGFDEKEDENLVRAVKEVEDQKWTLVAARLREISGRDHAPEICSTRYAGL